MMISSTARSSGSAPLCVRRNASSESGAASTRKPDRLSTAATNVSITSSSSTTRIVGDSMATCEARRLPLFAGGLEKTPPVSRYHRGPQSVLSLLDFRYRTKVLDKKYPPTQGVE